MLFSRYLILLLLLAAVPRVAHAIGPSFDCAVVHSPVAQVICSDSAMSQEDLRYAQAYYALRQQVGAAGWKALTQEAIAFEHAAAAQCGIPDSGAPADTAAAASCLRDAYEKQQVAWRSRLTGAAAEEADRPIDEHLSLQGDLIRMGLLPQTAKADGVYGEAMRAAILKWQSITGHSENGFLSEADAAGMRSNDKSKAADLPSPSSGSATKGEVAGSAGASSMIGYGNSAGEEAPIASQSGIGTSSAKITIIIGWSDRIHYCNEQYPDNAVGRDNCLGYERSSFKGAESLTATADCETGAFADFEGRHLTYAGERAKKIGEQSYTVSVIDYEGFQLGDYGYIGASTSADEYKAMCPAGRPLGPPLEELSLPSCEDQEFADEAAKTAVESGFAHLLNVKAIDVWDLKGTGSFWNRTTCSAKVTLNNGYEGMLYYSVFPRHGRIFVEARLE